MTEEAGSSYEAFVSGHVTLFFGPRWDAPMVDPPAQRVPVPVGKACCYCTEKIEEGDRGLFETVSKCKGDWSQEPIHMECSLRSIMGGLAHLEKRCMCFGGSDHDDTDGMTLRESAKAVLEFVDRERGVSLTYRGDSLYG